MAMYIGAIRLFFFFCLFLTGLSGSAGAAPVPGMPGGGTKASSETVILPEHLTPEIVRDLLSEMSDEQVRKLLREKLDAVAKEQARESNKNTKPFSQVMRNWLGGVYGGMELAVLNIPQIGSKFSRAVLRASGRIDENKFLFFLKVSVGVIIGLIAFFSISRGSLSKKIKQPDESASLREIVKMLASRLGVDLLALTALVFTSVACHRLILTDADRPLVRPIMENLVFLPLMISAFSRFLFAPVWSEARLVHCDDKTARFIHHSLVGMALLTGLLGFAVDFEDTFGAHAAGERISYLTYWINLALFGWLAYICIHARQGITDMLLGGDENATPAERRIATCMPWILALIIGFTWLVAEIAATQGRIDLLLGGRHYITLMAVFLVPVFDTVIKGLVRHLVPPMTGEGLQAELAHNATKRSYIRIGRIIAFGTIVIFIAELWDLSFDNLSSTAPGLQAISDFFEIILIIAIGYLIWELVTLWFNKKMAAERTAFGMDLHSGEIGGEVGGQGASRLSTILPMIKLVTQTLIVTMTVLLALSEFGIDITPLLAGAGIVGIAVGFGAQTLVKDIVSGVFFLIDDAFRIGEYLVIGTTVGTVEKLSVRSLQLRHHEGPVHTIPYGEIPTVTNNSRDWVIVKIKFTFPFETDVSQIKKIFKKVGADILETDYADDIIQTFKSQGVYDVDDVGIVIRGKFMAKPGTQWIIRKDIYTRVQKALDEAGIHFARREVLVQIPGLEDREKLSDQQKSAIGAAASEAVQDAPVPNGPE